VSGLDLAFAANHLQLVLPPTPEQRNSRAFAAEIFEPPSQIFLERIVVFHAVDR